MVTSFTPIWSDHGPNERSRPDGRPLPGLLGLGYCVAVGGAPVVAGHLVEPSAPSRAALSLPSCPAFSFEAWQPPGPGRVPEFSAASWALVSPVSCVGASFDLNDPGLCALGDAAALGRAKPAVVAKAAGPAIPTATRKAMIPAASSNLRAICIPIAVSSLVQSVGVQRPPAWQSILRNRLETDVSFDRAWPRIRIRIRLPRQSLRLP